MKVITFHPDADDEITEAAQYYEVRKTGLGSDFLGEVEQGLDQISTNPEASQRIGRRVRRKPLWRFPFNLIFAVYVEFESSGQPRQFGLHIPPGYLAGNLAPLVVNLHGLGGSGIQQDLLSGMSAKADEAGFIATHPEGRGDPQSWFIGPAVGGQQEEVLFIRDLINCLKNQLSIEPDCVYATGFSNGGGMVNRLGCDLADVIAAIGPVS